MTDKEIEKLIQMNNRICLILGYAMGFILPHSKTYEGLDKEKYKWLVKAVENLLYLDKPMPPMP